MENIILADQETIDKIKSGDLYALLSVSSDDDLDPLVKSILGRFSNSIDINDDYKKHQPLHSKYHKIIGDEVRLFGGNTFRNIIRGGEGPAYDEVVIDVCKKLKIPFDADDTVKNESNLLSIYLEQQWKALNQEEREKIVAEAREAASHHAVNIGSLAKEGGILLLTRWALGPIGWSSLVFSITDPAFKVTVPCILHIAYLRRKFLEKHAEATACAAGQVGSSLAIVEHSNLVTTNAISDTLIIGEADDNPLLSMTQISEPNITKWQSSDDSNDGINRLNPFFQAFPSLVTTLDVASTKYMEVVINGDLAKAAGGGNRAWTMAISEKTGKSVISEHATLFESSRLSNIVNAAAIWQIASVAVAQKHLADISHKLTEIKASVERVNQFQKNERRSALTGAIRYFEQVAESVLAGEISDSIRNQIEHHESELLQVQDHLLADIRHESEQITKVKDTDTFGSKGMQEAIRGHQRLQDDLYQQLLLCIRARACGWQLLVVFPGEARLKENRKRNIQEMLGALKESGDLLKHTDTFMRQKIRNLSSAWNMKVTLNERKLSLLEWNDTLIDQVAKVREGIDRDIQVAEAVIQEQRQPVKIALKIECGRIVASSAI